MVNRYDFEEFTGTYEPIDNGPVVKYEDYEALKQEFMDYVVIKERQIRELKSALEYARSDVKGSW